MFNWNSPSLTFDIALHIGTLSTLVWFFRSDWVRLIRALIDSAVERSIGYDSDRRLAWLLVIGTIAMAVIIILLGLVLFMIDKLARHQKVLNKLSLKDTLVIGQSQALAIFPGISRSGSTITGGLCTGLKRKMLPVFPLCSVHPSLPVRVC